MSATTYEEETGVDESNHDGSSERGNATSNTENPGAAKSVDATNANGANHREGTPVGAAQSKPNPAAETLTEAREDIADLVAVFKLLSDETRLKILFVLREADEMNVLELCGILGQRQPSVSHHLALLRVKGLIGMRRDGKHNFYHMRPSRLDEFVRTILKVAPGSDAAGLTAEAADEFPQADHDV